MTPEPVLVLVPGASGAPQDGSALFHVAEEGAPQLSVTDLAVTRGAGVFETSGVFDGAPVNVGPIWPGSPAAPAWSTCPSWTSTPSPQPSTPRSTPTRGSR